MAFEPAREGGERAEQAELLQGVRAAAGERSGDLLGAVPCGLAQLLELIAQLVRDTGGEPFDLQHHPGQRLADFVVQLRGDPLALRLLDRQGLPGAVTALGLQPVEHVVERLRQRDDVGIAASPRRGRRG